MTSWMYAASILRDLLKCIGRLLGFQEGFSVDFLTLTHKLLLGIFHDPKKKPIPYRMSRFWICQCLFTAKPYVVDMY